MKVIHLNKKGVANYHNEITYKNKSLNCRTVQTFENIR